LLLALFGAGVMASLGPLGLILSKGPDRLLQSFQELWQFGASVFVLPAVANVTVGFAAGRTRSWALLPLSLMVPAVVVVMAAGEAKGPLLPSLIFLSLVPACVTWLAGRLGQGACATAQTGSAGQVAVADPGHR
jgi:hypothetical protein